jgi:four helix bundle protein
MAIFFVWNRFMETIIMPTIKRFEDLEIWQLARQLENKIFEQTIKGKLARDFKLKDQMNNASGSVMDNIAEGFGRASRLEFIQFLSIAKGSGNEIESQLYRCLDRKYIELEKFNELYELAEKVCRKTDSMISYLNRSAVKGQKFKDRIR